MIHRITEVTHITVVNTISNFYYVFTFIISDTETAQRRQVLPFTAVYNITCWKLLGAPKVFIDTVIQGTVIRSIINTGHRTISAVEMIFIEFFACS